MNFFNFFVKYSLPNNLPTSLAIKTLFFFLKLEISFSLEEAETIVLPFISSITWAYISLLLLKQIVEA